MSLFLGLMAILSAVALLMAPIAMFPDNGWHVFLGLAVVATIEAAIAGYLFDHQKPVESYRLAASDWECSATYEARHFTGKIWVTRTECAEYSRKAE